MTTASMNPNIPLDVARAMTNDERADFLRRFIAINPRWQGAHVADVLEALDSGDSHLDIVEPLFEDHAHALPADRRARIGTCARAIVYAYGPQAVTWERVHALIDRSMQP